MKLVGRSPRQLYRKLSPCPAGKLMLAQPFRELPTIRSGSQLGPPIDSYLSMLVPTCPSCPRTPDPATILGGVGARPTHWNITQPRIYLSATGGGGRFKIFPINFFFHATAINALIERKYDFQEKMFISCPLRCSNSDTKPIVCHATNLSLRN